MGEISKIPDGFWTLYPKLETTKDMKLSACDPKH